MKKIGILSAALLLGMTIFMTNCRKKPIDPCENVRCEDYQKCVNGKCVDIRRK